jgi:hypothetical protein
MKFAIYSLSVFFLIFTMLTPSDAFFTSKAKVTIKVLEEDGSPVEMANVAVGFERNGKDDVEFKGLSGSAGFFTVSSDTNGHIGWTITKENYYETRGVYDFEKEINKSWQPWNPTVEVLLRKIENPVPMYFRDTKYLSVEIPVVDEEVGFDLVKFDWVSPYGKGTHEDFIFHLKRRVVDRKDFDTTLTVRFANSYDGIKEYREELDAGSLFMLPRKAPTSGYEKELVLSQRRERGDLKIYRNFDFNSKNINYFFRVRSEGKDDGSLDRSMYGKIVGGLRFDPIFSETAKIFFKYYLNPDYTRNLEHDHKKNIFDQPLLLN